MRTVEGYLVAAASAAERTHDGAISLTSATGGFSRRYEGTMDLREETQ